MTLIMTLIFLYNKKSLNPPSLSPPKEERERDATTHSGHMISSNASRHISFKLMSLRYSCQNRNANFLSLYTNSSFTNSNINANLKGILKRISKYQVQGHRILSGSDVGSNVRYEIETVNQIFLHALHM